MTRGLNGASRSQDKRPGRDGLEPRVRGLGCVLRAPAISVRDKWSSGAAVAVDPFEGFYIRKLCSTCLIAPVGAHYIRHFI